jgi:peptidoglycan/LPS O-acetylase OafA/YrhL
LQTVPQRYDSLQVLRILGAILVVTYHFGAVELQYGHDRLITPLLGYACLVIDAFFIVSGFLMGALYKTTPAGGAEVLDFVVRRLARIYPAYWLITIAVFAAWAISRRHLMSHLVGPDPHLISSLLLIPTAARPVLEVAWTLLHEVYFYAGFAVLLALKPSWRAAGLAVWALCVVVGYVLLASPQAHPGLALVVSPYTLEFIAGVCLGWWAPLIRRHAPRASLAAAVLVCFSGMALTGFSPARKMALPEALRIGLDGSVAFLMVYGLIAADMKRLWACPPRFVAAGDWSYALYLIHTVVIAGVCIIWRPFSRPGLIDNGLVYAICLGLSVILSAVFWIYLERPTTRFVGRLLRARRSVRLPATAPRSEGRAVGPAGGVLG